MPRTSLRPSRNLKLKPGMTANLEFQIEQRKNVLTVPNSALIFHPKPEQVRKSDVALVAGQAVDADDDKLADSVEKNEAMAAAKPGCVWVLEGNRLAAVKVVTGLTGKTGTEIVSGELTEGQEVITGVQVAAAVTK